ncbi:MAG TPA: sulfatase-like hydrolase/transferase [Pyrinomonadaceae bacterium]|nr:sulfatase-like hydrolase/transferase [Pyrinomonadaceae bacterium]
MENPTNTTPPNRPNIILLTVDQMRFPMNFKALSYLGINNEDDFIKYYMPNLYKYLWEPGVKFSNYYTAASDCTAARATIHTGLYAYQSYSMLTLITYPPKLTLQPILHPDFPTIGKLMREATYVTPYFGKWHLSYNADELEDYGL